MLDSAEAFSNILSFRFGRLRKRVSFPAENDNIVTCLGINNAI
jgi:hypothetical protein